MSETQSIEYKSSWRDEYLKWICGFANAQGGALYIGKDDDGKYVKGKGKITNREYVYLSGISNRTATNELMELVVKFNLLKKSGASVGVYYEFL